MAENGQSEQAKTEWGKEIWSRARWLGAYRLPKILAAPFQFNSFRIFYFLVTLILVLLVLISLPFLWTDLFRAILEDTLAKLGAEKSSDLAYQFLTSLFAGWLLFLWLAYGALARFWGEPRREFLDKIEKEGKLILLRGGGDRISFIKRLNGALNTGLGLGPTGELLAYYYPRPEDAAILAKAKDILHAQHPKGVLISAAPAMGKTRSALELIARLDPAMVIVWPRGYKLETHPALPVWKGRLAILADDLALSAAQDEGTLPQFLNYLAGHCP